MLQKKYPGVSPDARSTDALFIGTAGADRVIVLRRGDEVLWAEGIPAAQGDAVVEFLKSL